MRKILVSLSVIGIVSAVVIGATMAYFGDTETSTGNTMTAGSIDLKIDLHCPDNGCDFPLRDLLDKPAFFQECDIKPGDSGEVTISWHVYDNNAWARIRVADIYDYENNCTDPEIEAGDLTCDNNDPAHGELSQNLYLTVWLDEGEKPGWQCSEKPECSEDPLEGDNILNGIEDDPTFGKRVHNPLSSFLEGYVFDEEFIGSTTYYVGLKWSIPEDAGNIIQTDSLTGKIIMEAVQSRNNPNKEF